MLDSKFSPWPHYAQDEIDAVQEVLRSGRVNAWTGTQIQQFERDFAGYVGTEFALALANGTLALELALRGLGVGPGDEVIVTSRSFLASASAIVTVGATPVFADVELDSQNISAATIRGQISERTRAVICVHLAGWPCEMDAIVALCREQGLWVIEDCAQAHGARYRGSSVGSLGDVAAWSFCQDKIMSTGGEGGMVTTDDRELYAKMWAYKDHGKDLARVHAAKEIKDRRFKWLHQSFGSNYRMTQMQAAIGILQLQKLPGWQQQRAAHAAVLDAVVDASPVVHRPQLPSHIQHAYYKYYFFVEPSQLASGWDRDRIVQEMWARGVPCLGGSCSEIYREGAFEGTGFRPPAPLEHAVQLGERSLMMLVHPTLSEQELAQMAQELSQVLDQAQRRARLAM